MKKLFIGILALTSLSSFAQNTSSERFEELFAEADRAFDNRAIENEEGPNRYERLAQEAALAADAHFSHQMNELTRPELDIYGQDAFSERELACLKLLTLQVRLQSKDAKRVLKRRTRKDLLEKISIEKDVLSCAD